VNSAATRHRTAGPRAPATERTSEDHVRPGIMVLLDGAGCPACREEREADARWLRWFRIESHTEAPTLARLRASAGLCPAHARAVLDGPGGDHIVARVYRSVLAAREPLATTEPSAPCPACHTAREAGRGALSLLRREIGTAEVLSAYRDGSSLCIPHLRALAGEADPTLLAALSAQPSGDLVERVAGIDDDAAARAALRGRLARLGHQRPRGTTVDRVLDGLLVDACPSCLAAARAERRYLAWLAHEYRAGPVETLVHESAELCPTHLHDLRLSSPDVATSIAGAQAVAWHGRVERFDEMAREPARAPERVVDRVLGRAARARVATLGPGRAMLLRPGRCRACMAARTVERRETDLLEVLLGDTRVADRYRTAHGLCLRHVRGLGTGAAADLARATAAVRIETLGWELEELLRKAAWDFRHEPAGPEQTASRRVLAALDGRVFLGVPAEDGA
jgi:hypothetical protein